MWDIVQNYPSAQLLTFLLAGLALNLTPGADVLFATASGMRGGPSAGMAAGLGVGLGGAFHVSLAALGLAALVAAHPAALTAIRWTGAAYLLWLAWAVWHAGPPEPGARGTADPWRALGRGFLANVLNPKVIIFILAFLPQFTDPGFGPIWAQIVYLGAIFTATGTLVTMGYGALAGLLGRRLEQRGGIMNRIAAVIFAGLAARLAWE